ncbi:nucleotide exchange factor GrpE [Nocardioides sp. SYSU DS0651]|uniref:nucleotide exchange factor GrpE n=1 Tax=Nocardioides sp. SYSU DS0651 TaxID=3415955 RepID=UPI003F4B1951
MTGDPNARPEGERPEGAAPSPEGAADHSRLDDVAARAEEAAPVPPPDPDGAAGADGADGAGGADGAPGQGAASAEGDELAVTRMELEERTLDLQRLQADYLNYKRRVERDRELLKENATYAALTPIVDVLDTIDRAREHEPLEGGFKAVAEQLERVVTGLGLVKFGEPGDPFDPTVHEALSHVGTDPEVEVTTCKVIAKAGYKIGDRVVRAAQVLVVDPADPQ